LLKCDINFVATFFWGCNNIIKECQDEVNKISKIWFLITQEFTWDHLGFIFSRLLRVGI
jgi:hypothetical protein